MSAPSKLRAGKLATAHVSVVTRWLGRIGPRWTAELDEALIALLPINTVPHREAGHLDERERLVGSHAEGGPPRLLSDLGISAG